VTSAALARALPAHDWYTTDRRGRLQRNCVILAIALALHLLAALALTSVRGRGPGPRVGPVITTMWLIGAEQAVRAAAPAQATQPASPRAKSRMPFKRDRVVAPTARVEAEPQPEPAPQKATLPNTTPTVRATDYPLARRSLAFGGSPPRDEAPPVAKSARTLDGWVNEGIARSVWAVANELAAAGDGWCEVAGPDAQGVCDTAELSAAWADVPEPAQRSLATWVRGGFVRAIEIRIDQRSARYTVRF